MEYKRRISLLLIAVTLIFLSCHKEKTVDVSEKIQYTLSKTHALPQEALVVTANKPLQKDTCSILIGDQVALLIRLDSFSYGLFMPVLSPGHYLCNFVNAGGENSPEITIDNYTPIADADAEILKIHTQYDKLVDSLQASSFKGGVTTNDATFLHQLLKQVDEHLKNCTSEQKMLVSYQMRNMDLSAFLTRGEAVDTAYIAAKATQQSDEISTQMEKKILEATVYRIASYIAAGAAAISLKLITKKVDAYSISAVCITIGAYCLLTKATRDRTAEAAALTGLAVRDLGDENGNGTVSKPIDITSKQPKLERLKCIFRTLCKQDALSSDEEISGFVSNSDLLEKDDRMIKNKFDNIVSTLSSFFGTITASYKEYISPILPNAIEKLVQINSKFITISDISNPSISVIGEDDGPNGYKITMRNPDFTIAATTPVSFKITYTQGSFGNVVSATLNINYIPKFSIGDTLTAGIVFYLDGNGQHGMVCSIFPLNGCAWEINSSPTRPSAGALQTAIGTGSQNTTNIIASIGNGSNAASECRNYNAGGYTDWFLPSLDELNEIYVTRNITHVEMSNNDVFWSSSEANPSYAAVNTSAWNQSMNTGLQNAAFKGTVLAVRAVRSF